MPKPAPAKTTPIVTGRLILRQPEAHEAAPVVHYFIRNRDHLAPWEPLRKPEFYTQAHWRPLLAADRADLRDGFSARFFVFEQNDPGRVIGTCNLNNIVRGAFQACHMGYSIDAGCQGRGLGREAVGALVDFAFDSLGLHRVMANYQPENSRSARLLASLGFTVEGHAADYLLLNGRWCDHVLTSRVCPDWAGGGGR